MLILSFILLNGAFFVGSEPEAGPATPDNVTVQLIDSKTVEVFWSTSWKNVERYDVTYNPTENRVVSQAAGNSHSIILRELRPDTQYQVTVTAVVGGKNYRSRRLVFRTSNDPLAGLDREDVLPVPTKPTKMKKSYPVTPEVINPDPTAVGSKYTPPTSTTVRGVEIGLVLLALVVWIIAIALFFHRWGKIRMLLPYQPDYKTQQSLKVPGTGTTVVSGCTGTSTSQGQQEGPGCVQHLRWSSRTFDEPSTAKKCSPSRWALRPRVSSAVFPASHSFFYTRTSAECDSPRVIRHAHSHSDFPTEVIPLCQVTQPRSESPDHVISITVPAIASSVNEKTKKSEGKASEGKRNSRDDDKITKFEESDFYKVDNKEKVYSETGKKDLGGCCPRGQERGEKRQEEGPLFFVESAGFRPPDDPEKPRRYNRTSLKKQKVRLCDDRDLEPCKIVPIIEYREEKPAQKPHEPESRKSKNLKTVEMKRKAFLRKVSLQDTYLNYNQDYWLDFKNSGRFHKSIDLGYLGNEETPTGTAEPKQRAAEARGEPFVLDKSNQTEPLMMRQSKLLSIPGPGLKRSGSVPVFLDRDFSCKNCNLAESNEALPQVVAECQRKEGPPEKKSSWFFLPSNENIPLFSERNGLIETDFDVLNDLLDEERLLVDRTSSSSPEDKGRDFAIDFSNFSNFYEIQLTSEGEGGEGRRAKVFDFQGGDAFFGRTFTSFSGDSDVSIETEPPRIPEHGTREFSYFVHSSSSPPKSTPD